MIGFRPTTLIALLLTSFNAIGHDVAPVHGYTEPYYEIDYYDDEALARLAAELDAYSECLKAFMSRHVEQSTVHQKATMEALDSLTAIQQNLRDNAPKEVLEEARFDYED